MGSRCIRRVNVLVPLAVALSCAAYGATPSGSSQDSPPSKSTIDGAKEEGAGSAVSSDTRSIQCTPVSTSWPVAGGDRGEVTAPQWAVVRTDFRPKDVEIHLDGRFVGRARYFNGKKGYLFLEPGRYRLEVRLAGYRSVLFQIEARPNCRFDIRHRMTRSRDSRNDSVGDKPGKGIPTQRVFSPVGSEHVPPDPGTSPGPDVGLRPDLTGPKPPATTSVPRTSSLVIKVEPVTASVFLDGTFLATGKELGLMVGPVAIPAGSHVIEVRAPGFVGREIELEIAAGELREIAISLQGIDDN